MKNFFERPSFSEYPFNIVLFAVLKFVTVFLKPWNYLRLKLMANIYTLSCTKLWIIFQAMKIRYYYPEKCIGPILIETPFLL